MEEFMIYILFVVGFVFLLKGADMLIEGATALAKRFGISAFLIGLTIVAFGTSVPELAVNVYASYQGNTDIVLGNILGSNVANIFLVLGLSAVMVPIVVRKKIIRKELPLSLVAILIVFLLTNDFLVNGADSFISRDDGIILLVFFLVFLYYIFTVARKGKSKKEIEESSDVKLPKNKMMKSIIFIIVGLAGLSLGGQWIIDGAVHIASELGMSESLIGLTIVAFGTSISEVAASVMAIRRKVMDMVIGNIIGSNIFNIFWVLGISAVIAPIAFDFSKNMEIFAVIFATVLLFVFLLTGKKYSIGRKHGIIFLILYVAFIIVSVLRG